MEVHAEALRETHFLEQFDGREFMRSAGVDNVQVVHRPFPVQAAAVARLG